MKKKAIRYFIGDFETTVYENQEYTEVWAAGLCELFTEEAKIFNKLIDMFEYLAKISENCYVYFHNLKFDGSFWLPFLLQELEYKQAFNDPNADLQSFRKYGEMNNKTFKYSISEMGQWYNIIIKVNDKEIQIRDSLKLLPFSVRKIGESFGTKHKKLDMEYEGERHAGGEITPEEQEYLKNDLYVVKEALEILMQQGHDKMTIGSCCMADFKKDIFHTVYEERYPDITKIEIDEKYGCTNADRYIRNAYRGGWCYLVKGKENQIKTNGVTADVNSLYPSMMHSESGNVYPVGKPIFFEGDLPRFLVERLKSNPKSDYYFIRIKTRFRIKENHLPFIQVKGSFFYDPTEMLETSDIYDKKNKCYTDKYYDINHELQIAKITLTLTCTDYELLKEHYYLYETEYLDGCYFGTETYPMFDEYIDKYKKIKMESKGAVREIAKLFLNNLYGKMATGTNSTYKVCYVKDDGVLGFYDIPENEKKVGYIPIGAAITSYARNFTIRAAQANYYGKDKRGFIYADTDSIHCDLLPSEIKGIKIDDKEFCCWKLESSWDKAIFVRQKTYIEHVTQDNLKDINPRYEIRCAGMPKRCKDIVKYSLNGFANKTEQEKQEIILKEKYRPEEQKDLYLFPTLNDFKLGMVVHGKLLPKRIKGGIVLGFTTYEMR